MRLFCLISVCLFAACQTNGRTEGLSETGADISQEADASQFDVPETEAALCGKCGCGVLDTDEDGDGEPDCTDGCPKDPLKTEPGKCGCGVAETDQDGDLEPDCTDACPSDPLKTEGGKCGCGVLDTDEDGDGEPDCTDGCPKDPSKIEPGECGCGRPDTPKCAEVMPPKPDPMEWAVPPYPTGTTSIAMQAVKADDESGVEYYFECFSGPCHDSGWQESEFYEDKGLAPDNIYGYRVKARDKGPNQNETGWSSEYYTNTERDSGFASGIEARYYDFGYALQQMPDFSGLVPNVARIESQVAYLPTTDPWPGLSFADTFASRHGGFLRVVEDGVYTLYLVSDNGSRLYLDAELLINNPGMQYPTEKHAVRYLNAGYHPIIIEFYENIGTAALVLYWSGPGINKEIVPATALYHADPPDIWPPSPNPPEWELPPTALGADSVVMTAAPATDNSGVLYKFECIVGQCHSSGWQVSRTYLDTSLQPGTQYAWRIRTKDFSLNENMSFASNPMSATTYTFVPNVKGLSLEVAIATITTAALEVGNVSTVYDDTIPLGHVISEEPAPGTLLPAGSKVDLIVSKGVEPVMVPDVVGMDQDSAITELIGARLGVGTINTSASCKVPVGRVIAQEPPSGTSVPKGSLIDLVISRGPESVVITEIMYHPKVDGTEFLELFNPCPLPVLLSGYEVKGIGAFRFPEGAYIEPYGYLVLAQDASAFKAEWDFYPDFVYPGSLANSGENIKVVSTIGEVVDEVIYDDEPPWPVTPDGLGPSLEVIDPLEDNSTPRNWHASIAGATPRAVNSVNAIGLPPWITEVSHGTPAPGQPIVVTAKVEDALSATLTYVINWDSPVTEEMTIQGYENGNKMLLSASIPAQAVGTIVRYRIDTIGPNGKMGFPRDDDTVSYTGTYLAPEVNTDLDVFHWLIHPDDYAKALAHYYTDDTEPAMLFHHGVLYDGVRIRVRGQSSRGWPKKHWNFEFPQGHGFNAPFYTVAPVGGFNMQSSYADKSYIRETLSYETFRDAGCPSNIIRPVALYQNGQFFGLYSYLEDRDADNLERNGLDHDGSLYRAVDSQCEPRPLNELKGRWEKDNPKDDDFQELYEFLNGVNQPPGQARREFLFDNVDIPAMINYQAANIIIHNNDHPAKNYFLYRDRLGTGRWFMLPWDMDLTFGRNFQGKVLNDDIFADVDVVPGRPKVSPSHPLFGDSEHQKWDYLWNRLIDALLKEPDIREMYYRRLRTLMDELLVEGKYEARIDELSALVADEAEADRQKWGWYGVAETPDQAVSRLKQEYLAVRRVHLFVTHRVDGEIPNKQSASPVVVINEIMYHPPDDELEFIELYNPTSESIDLSFWTVVGVDMQIPAGSVILPNGYMLLVRNDKLFRAQYGPGHFIAGQYKGKLDNGGELVALIDRDGNVVDAVNYDDNAPWPKAADGEGASLELLDPFLDNSLPSSWAASKVTGGTPGFQNSVP